MAGGSNLLLDRRPAGRRFLAVPSPRNMRTNMEHGSFYTGELEIRARDDVRTLVGRFPYNTTATVRAVGRQRKERFKPMSLSWQVREFQKLQARIPEVIESALDKARKQILLEQLEDELERRNTFLLVGHDYNRTVADMKSGTLTIEHTAAAVELEATLPPDERMPSWVRDAVLAIEGKQLRGISPGFVVSNKGSERLVAEDGPGDALVREILDATAYEYSVVSRPAYPTTSVDAREFEGGEAPRRRRVWL